MPIAASGAWARIAPSLSISRMLRRRNRTPGPSGARCRMASSILTCRSDKLAVDGRLDGGNEAGKRDRTAAEPPIAEHDGDQPDHQDAGEDFAADMGAAHGKLLEFDLHRLGHAPHQGAAPLGQGKDRPCCPRWSASRERLRSACWGRSPPPRTAPTCPRRRACAKARIKRLRTCARSDRIALPPSVVSLTRAPEIGSFIPSMAPPCPGPRRTHCRPRAQAGRQHSTRRRLRF